MLISDFFKQRSAIGKNSSIIKFTLNKEHYLEKIIFWGFLVVIFGIHKILTDFKY